MPVNRKLLESLFQEPLKPSTTKWGKRPLSPDQLVRCARILYLFTSLYSKETDEIPFLSIGQIQESLKREEESYQDIWTDVDRLVRDERLIRRSDGKKYSLEAHCKIARVSFSLSLSVFTEIFGIFVEQLSPLEPDQLRKFYSDDETKEPFQGLFEVFPDKDRLLLVTAYLATIFDKQNKQNH